MSEEEMSKKLAEHLEKEKALEAKLKSLEEQLNHALEEKEAIAERLKLYEEKERRQLEEEFLHFFPDEDPSDLSNKTIKAMIIGARRGMEKAKEEFEHAVEGRTPPPVSVKEVVKEEDPEISILDRFAGF